MGSRHHRARRRRRRHCPPCACAKPVSMFSQWYVSPGKPPFEACHGAQGSPAPLDRATEGASARATHAIKGGSVRSRASLDRSHDFTLPSAAPTANAIPPILRLSAEYRRKRRSGQEQNGNFFVAGGALHAQALPTPFCKTLIQDRTPRPNFKTKSQDQISRPRGLKTNRCPRLWPGLLPFSVNSPRRDLCGGVECACRAAKPS